MISKKKKQPEIHIHQHEDEFGRVFGAKHPLNAHHKNPKTKKDHETTVKKYEDNTQTPHN